MKHENIKELLMLYSLNELNENESKILDEHLLSCEECSKELKQLQLLSEVIKNNKPEELDEYELQKSRMKLLDSLDELENNRTIWGIIKNNLSKLSSKNISPAIGFAATLVIGFLLGYTTPEMMNQNNDSPKSEMLNVGNDKGAPVIDNVTFLSSNPESGEVELGYTISKQIYYKGNFNDDQTKRLIALAVTNSNNSGLKITGINVINNHKDKEYIKDEKIKNALITAAKGDKNAGVRRQALITLGRFKPDDIIIETYLFVLTKDNNAAIRIEAINRLTEIKSDGYKIDEKTKSIIGETAEKDDNKLVQIRAAKFINEEI